MTQQPTQESRFIAARAKGLLAKFACSTKTTHEGQETVRLHAVYSDDPTNPNHAWSLATPAGTIELTISNPAAFGVLVPGREYFVEFHAVPKE